MVTVNIFLWKKVLTIAKTNKMRFIASTKQKPDYASIFWPLFFYV